MTIDISPEAVENLWRFWVNKAQALADENKALSAALTASQAETALAALAMRERAAEICFVPEQAHIAWDMKNGNFPKRSARHEYIAAEIRALPTTFTDAELLAAAMQLPEVR